MWPFLAFAISQTIREWRLHGSDLLDFYANLTKWAIVLPAHDSVVVVISFGRV